MQEKLVKRETEFEGEHRNYTTGFGGREGKRKVYLNYNLIKRKVKRKLTPYLQATIHSSLSRDGTTCLPPFFILNLMS